MRGILWSIVALFLAAACSGTGTDIIENPGADALFDAVEAAETQGEDGSAGLDLAEIWFPSEDLSGDDVGFDAIDFGTPKDIGIPPGEAGYACQDGDDCNSGFCIQTPMGKQCTIGCLEECPFGWLCVQHQPSLPDEIFICSPQRMNLCKPCQKNSDCLTNGAETGDTCLAYGAAGQFCGAACMGNGDCPDEYECKAVLDIWGYESNQCVLKTGECDCEPWFVDEGASTTCAKTNEHGECAGERTCTAQGLSECSAEEPSQELCNGVDDDCDEEIDEGAGGDTCYVENQWGACKGTYLCAGGQLSCDADEPAGEICDGNDNDCDGLVDEGFPDSDQDGLADCLENDIDGDGIVDIDDNCPKNKNPDQVDSDLDMAGDACDPDDDNDQVADGDDCAPTNSKIHPDADEICNALDDNCNGMIDEGFVDSDMDALKDCVDLDDDNDGFLDADDCEPTESAVNPDADEACDGLDNNCDNDVDEGFGDTDGDGEADCVDPDLDGDGLANEGDNCPALANETQADQDGDGIGDICDQDIDGDGIAEWLDNCPDMFNPGQKDLDGDGDGDACDDDVDGDGTLDDDDNCPWVANELQEDVDEDGLGDACDVDADGDGDPDVSDCQPANPYVFNGAEDICDGLDNDCTGLADEGFPDTDFDGVKNCVDADDDGDGDDDLTDCSPLDPDVAHGAEEVCNGIDDDCDSEVDQGIGSLACGKGECFHTVPICMGGVVQECDPLAQAGDEVCDGLDNDCDGQTDEDMGWSLCGVGACAHVEANCQDGEPTACDPQDGAKEETCDGLDNDCDGLVDEAGAEGCEVYYLDGDGDGHGLAETKCLCEPSGLYKGLVGDDCNDLNPWIFPGATELCDQVDNDCDDVIDEDGATGCAWFFADGDGDGYGSGDANCVCSAPGAGWSVLAGDCNEDSSEVHPGALELCDDSDNDCDNEIDETFDLNSDAKNCGECGKACQPDNAFGKCVAQECKVEDCFSGFGDCNDKAFDGCEIETAGDADNCGECGAVCDLPHATATCALGSCEVDECDEHYADDDGVAETGCETVNYGNSSNNPGVTCLDIIDVAPAAEDGEYWIDVDGDGGRSPTKVYCDMTTEGGGWTFFMHYNQDYGSNYTNPMHNDIGTYLPSRVDNNTTYSLGIADEILDSELMVTLDHTDPVAAAAAHKFVIFKYNPNAPGGFNHGPLPCSGGFSGYTYRSAIDGPQLNGGGGSCNDGHWFPQDNSSQNTVGNHGGAYGSYWGAGIGGNNSHNHDGWYYYR